MPLISVIIPCYKQARWLPEALECLQRQSFGDWEAIVVNDASPDDTAAVARHWVEKDARIRLIDLGENVGVCRARNLAIAEARGTYLLPLDADDTLSPGYLENAVAILEKDPGIKLVYGRGELTGNASGPYTLPPYSYRQQLLGNCIHNSALIRRKDVLDVGGYDERMADGLEDWELWIRLLQPHDRVRFMEKQVYYYRQVSESRSESMGNSQQRLNGAYTQLFLKHYETYLSVFGRPHKWLRDLEQLRTEKAHWKGSFRFRFGQGIIQFLKRN